MKEETVLISTKLIKISRDGAIVNTLYNKVVTIL